MTNEARPVSVRRQASEAGSVRAERGIHEDAWRGDRLSVNFVRLWSRLLV